jgi:outer membrane protein TolC
MNNKSLICIIYLLISQNIFAQKTPVSLKNCIERAQQSSFFLKADEQKIESAQKNYQFESSQSRPQIAGELISEQRMLEPYHFAQNAAFVRIDWALGKFFLNTAQAANQEVLSAETEREQSRLDVSLRAAMLYLNILMQQVQTNLFTRRIDLLNAHYNVSEALWRAGTRTQFDLLQTESETVKLKEEITWLEIDRNNLLQELGYLIDEKDIENIELQPFNAETVCSQPVPDFMPDVLQTIPMIQRINFMIKAQQFHTLAVKAQQLPFLSMTGGYMTDGDPTGDGNYWQVGAGVALPLYQWNATKYKRQASEARVQALNFQKKEIERDLSITIRQTRQRLAKLKGLIQLQQERLKSTEKAFELAEANYKAGMMTNLEYLAAQQQFTETQIEIHKTQLDYVVSLVRFYIVTNQLDKIELLDKLR